MNPLSKAINTDKQKHPSPGGEGPGMRRLKRCCTFIMLLLLYANLSAQSIITDKSSTNSYALITASQSTAIYTDAMDDSLIQIAAALLQQDMENVTGKKPVIIHQITSTQKSIIVIGNSKKSIFIKQLITAKKLTDQTINKWEAYQIQSIQNPIQGVDHALVIMGSDRRGTAYGVFELSKQIGVSPWYWWADVPVAKKQELYVSKTAVITDAPVVKYRGIFLNDEAPALSGWTKEKFGGFNHQFYEKVFELLLRLKANYLWPAMWGNAFNDDDTLNPVMADKWGIVMGTSHHEPMLRAQQEWKRYGKGAWNYTSNDTVLRSFWRKGIQNMGTHESIVTVGMRGDGDEPMTEGTATALLERIVADQRKIITDVTGKPASETPQLWALYKEVQDYYDKGMRVPDDVTLLLCDDNWGNIRKLPKPGEKPRKGGYGIYYHFDYVGGPRNYKWINTNNIPRIWEQMNLAYEYKATQIWIVNVGDLKPMELPISFFLDQAWNPKQFNAGNLQQYTQQWAAQQFNNQYAKDIGFILDKYTQYNARRKPELLSPETYSIDKNREATKVVEDYNELMAKAGIIYKKLPVVYRDAYYQLVLHPVQASANLNELYVTVAHNRRAAQLQRIEANELADRAKQLYAKDSAIAKYYNDTLAGGKWHHMMDQTHIGYTYWQQPPFNKMPDVKYVSNDSSNYSHDHVGPLLAAEVPENVSGNIFKEVSGYVSMQAEHFTTKKEVGNIYWQAIPYISKDGGGITSFPTTLSVQNVSATSPHLEYEIYTYDTGKADIQLYFSPTLPFNNTGLRYAISIDDEKPQIINLHKDYNEANWNKWVADNIIIQSTTYSIGKPGKHIVKYWLVDPAIVLQKLVLDFGDVKPGYLGPPETLHISAKSKTNSEN